MRSITSSTDGLHGDEHLVEPDYGHDPDLIADERRQDRLDAESVARMERAFTAISLRADEPAMEVLLSLHHDFGLTPKEFNQVVHRWVVS